MDVVLLIIGFLLSILLLSFALSPTLVYSNSRLGRWWRRHIADIDPESTQEENKEEGQEK